MFARAIALAIAIATFAAFNGAAAQTANQPPDTMAARVEACTPCHGNKGEGTSDVYFPRLAGKPAGYLYNQLLAFRSGRRKYPPMNYLLEFCPIRIWRRWRNILPASTRLFRSLRQAKSARTSLLRANCSRPGAMPVVTYRPA